MALTVRTSAAPRINTSVKKVALDLVNLEQLNNIDSTNLSDGYTLIYDAAADKWVAQAVTGVTNIDGGTF